MFNAVRTQEDDTGTLGLPSMGFGGIVSGVSNLERKYQLKTPGEQNIGTRQKDTCQNTQLTYVASNLIHRVVCNSLSSATPTRFSSTAMLIIQ